MSAPRPTRDALLMDTASLWSQRSTCDRAHVGAVFSRGGRVLVTGYNGAPAGMNHCVHEYDLMMSDFSSVPLEKRWRDPSPCTVAVHAEANGIAWAAREGVRLNGCELHTTRAMCANCAMLIINAGVIRCTWREPHRDMTGLELMMRAGIEVRSYAS